MPVNLKKDQIQAKFQVRLDGRNASWPSFENAKELRPLDENVTECIKISSFNTNDQNAFHSHP